MSIHKRFRELLKEFRKPSHKKPEDLSLKQIDLEDDITKFWPEIRRIGQRVGVDLPTNLDTVRAIINNNEIVEIHPSAHIYLDAIEMEEAYGASYRAEAKVRDGLIKDLDRILVRLNKYFGVNKEIKSQQSLPQKLTGSGRGSKSPPASRHQALREAPVCRPP